MLVYDIIAKESFENISRWLSELKQHADSNIVILLIGNKRDMAHLREVPKDRAEQFCKENGLADFLETSAKDNENIEIAYERLISLIYEARTSLPPDPDPTPTPVPLTPIPKQKPKCNNC